MRLAASDRKKQLIQVATRLFSEQGFDGTSTREIAEAAGVNESLIFRHFPTKEDLFWAVLSERSESTGRKRQIRELLGSNKSDREIFTEIARILLDRNEDDAAVTRLLLFSALRNNQLSDRFFRRYLAEIYEVMADLIRTGIADGRFRDLDPIVAARAFLGMIVYHYLVQEILGGRQYSNFSPQQLAEQMADMILNGIAVQQTADTAPDVSFAVPQGKSI